MMDKKRIIFVDDEPNILDGLRRMLRSMRKEFELCFAESGRAALDIMAEKEFDVVVSDMRMPGMDGATLLKEVQSQYPHSIRIMLTGQADDESVLRTIGVVHQFLAKPCDPDKLKDILRRASALHQLMVDGALKDLVSGIDTLPSLPSMYSKLQDKLSDPDASVEEVADIISQDIAMTAKVLQLVNSAFFGLFQKVDSPSRAVTLLGLDTIKALVLGLQIFSEIQISKKIFSIESLWKHSMTVGSIAKKIAMEVSDDKDISNNSFIAGILHDIGKLILVSKMEDKYKTVMQLALDEGITLRDAEKKVFNSTHCDMGAYLIGLWGFPSDIVEAIGFHHQLELYPGEGFSPALAVHVANVLYYDINDTERVGAKVDLHEEYLQERGLEGSLDTWREMAQDYMENMA